MSELLPKDPALIITLTTLEPDRGMCFSLTSIIDSPSEMRFNLHLGEGMGSWAPHEMPHSACSLPFQL